MAKQQLRGPRVTIRQRATGWSCLWRADGRQHSEFRPTLAEAEALQGTIERGDYVVSDKDSAESEPFEQAAERFIATGRTAKTREKYNTILTVHLTKIAGRKLSDVARDRDGIQALTVNQAQGKAMLALIRSTCQAAVNAGRLSSHRLDGLKCNHVPGIRELIFATPEQISQIAHAMGEVGLAVRIMRTCGLRPAEVLALRDTDLMLNGMLHVSRQVQNGKVIPLKHRQDFKGRDIPVPPTLRAMIRAHVKAHGLGNLFKIKYSAFNARFKRARDAAGPYHYANGSVAPTGLFILYQLRHGFASALLPKGVALTDVSRGMGHADTRETSRVYAGLMPPAARCAGERTDRTWRDGILGCSWRLADAGPRRTEGSMSKLDDATDLKITRAECKELAIEISDRMADAAKDAREVLAAIPEPRAPGRSHGRQPAGREHALGRAPAAGDRHR